MTPLFTVYVDGEMHVLHASWDGVLNILSILDVRQGDKIVTILPYHAPSTDLEV